MVSFKISRTGRRYIPEGEKVSTVECPAAIVSQVALTSTVIGKRVRQEDGDAVLAHPSAVRD